MRKITRACPLCGWIGDQFAPMIHPHVNHYDSRCPQCKSVERHRLAYMLMKDRIPKGKQLLHFAPEPALQKWLMSVAGKYTSADIDQSKAMVKIDITNINLPNESVDVIWCSHVLEHVDDIKALSELHRILAKGGMCVIQVPVWGDITQEDKSVTDPAERERLYFQNDHVRRYGIDIVDRLSAAGFAVTVLRDQHLEPEIVYNHCLSFSMTNEVFVCVK